MSMLTVVIGIIFVLLLLSLLATTIMELLAAGLALRGKNLEKALKNMLANEEDESVLAAFQNNSLYKQLCYHYGKKRYAPSYITAESFQSILFNIILEGKGIEELRDKINELPDSDLRNVLNQLLDEADGNIDDFKDKVQKWYDNIMDRASGWYKRNTQKILVIVGILIAVVFNADTIAIYGRLEKDPQSLENIVSMAEQFVDNGEGRIITENDPDFQQSLDELKYIVNDEIEAVKSPLGLGWQNVNLIEYSWVDWAIKVLGWAVTALAISLGAPFWFDLLNNLVNIRGAGKKPESSSSD